MKFEKFVPVELLLVDFVLVADRPRLWLVVVLFVVDLLLLVLVELLLSPLPLLVVVVAALVSRRGRFGESLLLSFVLRFRGDVRVALVAVLVLIRVGFSCFFLMDVSWLCRACT